MNRLISELKCKPFRSYPEKSLRTLPEAEKLRQSDPESWEPIVVQGDRIIDGLLRVLIAKERGLLTIKTRGI